MQKPHNVVATHFLSLEALEGAPDHRCKQYQLDYENPKGEKEILRFRFSWSIHITQTNPIQTI